MLTGAHFLLYSADPLADQAFLRDLLGLRAVEAGEGRLILALPPAEIATHPPASGGLARPHAGRDLLGAVLYLMCDDLRRCVDDLASRGVSCTGIVDTEFGAKTTLPLPSGGEIGLYQPSHPTALKDPGDAP